MKQEKIGNIINIVESWISSSQEDFDTMIDLHKTRRYSWAMFLGHLCVEKLLKAYFVKMNHEHSPITHNLLRLAELSKLNLSNEQKTDFATMTTFNLNARYDDYKQSFYNKCTKEFADLWIEKITNYQQWIKELLK
jgi:HEPN domain-containing protein